MKPILFNTEMVRAILEGRKTVTRRVVKPQPRGRIAYCMAGYKCGTWSYPGDMAYRYWGEEWRIPEGLKKEERNRHWTPPCNTDDILYVRETWAKCQNAESYVYKADFDGYAAEVFQPIMKWCPSIHMPKEAARIFLRVTDVRVERLQEITVDGCKTEGIKPLEIGTEAQGFREPQAYLEAFEAVWDSNIKYPYHPRYGWAANPWVFVIEFERCEKPERGRE